MSLFVCKWKKEFDSDVKEKIREDICTGFADLTGIDKKFFAVLFEDFPEGDFSDQGIGVFVLVYRTESDDAEFKDKAVKVITDAFCAHTPFQPNQVSIMIHDIWKGSMGTNGKIVNRSGAVSDALKTGTVKLD